MDDDDTQWVVEEIQNEGGIVPTIVDEDGDGEGPDAQEMPTSTAAPSDRHQARKRQRLEKKKAAVKRRRQEQHDTHSRLHGVELLPAEDQAQAFRALFTKQIDLEAVQACDFATVEFDGDRNLERLPAAVQTALPDWRAKLLGQPSPGGPVLLVVTYAATRAVQIIKALRPFQTAKLPIAKLFAKHLKITEQVAALEGDVRVAVGTPNRLLKLFDAGALSSTYLENVVIDMGLDAKNFNLFDIHATRDDFLALFEKYLARHLRSRSGHLRLCLY